MSWRELHEYRVIYRVGKGAKILLMDTQGQLGSVEVSTPADAQVIISLLQSERPIYYFPEKGLFSTNRNPSGDEHLL